MAVILIISGPAGSGKTTVCDQLVETYPGLKRFVTTTSRSPRSGEVDGVDYHFLEPSIFKTAIEKGDFFEWAFVHGRYYGSQRSHFFKELNAGHDLLFNIDVQGAQSIGKSCTEMLKDDDSRCVRSLFIKPASLDQIRKRMEQRGSDDPEEIQLRLESAKKEIAQADAFDKVILSGSKEEDFRAVSSYYESISTC